MIKVNNQEIKGKEFAYDGCHKIYIIENDDDREKALEYGYSLYPIEELRQAFNDSCDLRFISNWSLGESYVAQFEDAIFEGEFI